MMSKISLVFQFLFVYLGVVYSQDTLTIAISNRYMAKAIIDERTDYTISGRVSVYDRQTNALLIEQESTALPDDEGVSAVNVKQLPYGEQSLIQYNDFNFDGIDDLAISDGNNSCYGGPSYQVYLADGKGGFVYSDEFTDLAQSYCGFFSVDYDKQLIYTMTKSGCCWHWVYTFDVRDNKPRMIEEVEEGANNVLPFILNSKISQLKNNQMQLVEQESMLDVDGMDVIFSFELQNKDKKVVLFRYDDILFYAFINSPTDNDNASASIDFLYPSEQDYQKYLDQQQGESTPYTTFVLHQSEDNQTLTFANPSATYQIYNTPHTVGIKVRTGGKVYDMPGEVGSRKPTWADKFSLRQTKLKNLIVE